MAAIGPHRRYFCKTEKFSGRTPYANEIVRNLSVLAFLVY